MRHIIIKESYESLRIVDDFYDYEGEYFYGNYSCEKIISRREAHELYNYAMSKKLDMDNILKIHKLCWIHKAFNSFYRNTS